MTDIVDAETGEINAVMGRRLPGEIARAIIEVMREVKQLGFDERNEHGKYQYVSIDKFMESVRPLCAAAGIYFLLDETEVDVRPGGREGATSYLFIVYDVWIGHEQGAMAGPWRRRCYLPATGPQAFGSAESFVLKRFQRNLFQIATGERDADETAAGSLPERPARTASKMTPAQHTPAQTASVEDARESWRYLNQAIASCTTAGDLLAVYDTVAEEWGPGFAEHFEKVKRQKLSVALDLTELAKARMNALVKEEELA